MPLLLTLRRRNVHHLYVSVWYISAALLWFPILYVVAKVPHVHFGVEQAIVNWWYAHNVLGLWLTPLGLGAAYYFIAKVLGRPIYSYSLSLVGFWALAMFYSQAGIHHLIGGPVPNWLVSVSVVQSVMMIIPVLAVGLNQHMTVAGRFATLKYSPTLRFVVLGAALYTLVSLAGITGSLALLQSACALHAIQSGPRAFGRLRLLLHDHVRLDLLRDAACPGARMALSQSCVAALLAGSDRLWDLLRFPDDRRRLAGHRHARPRAAVHGLRRGPDALSAGENVRRRADGGGTRRLRVPLLRHGSQSRSAPIRQRAAGRMRAWRRPDR